MPTPFTTVLTQLGSLGAGPWAAGLGTSPLREEPLASGKSSQQLGQLGLHCDHLSCRGIHAPHRLDPSPHSPA